MVGRTSDCKEELRRFLKPFLDRLGHKPRRQMCPLYVSGLIDPGDRKSIQPMAERLAFGEYDQLHHFIAAGVWDAAPVETELLVQADRLVGGSDAVLVIDDTAIPKKGTHSVGVAAQYASALGKTANCQTLVSLTLARGEVPVMLALRLFLPESWTSKRARLERAGVPTEYRTARTKPEMALAEIDRVIAAGVRFACVLADAGYGLSAPFRQGLTARKLAWAVGIPRHLKVYPADVQMIWPVAGRGRPRKRHVPDILSMAAEDMLADATWQNISWRTGTKGKLKARFAAVRVRIADGPPQRIRDKRQQHLPGEEAWLIGEHRMSGEKKHYLANLPAKMDLRADQVRAGDQPQNSEGVRPRRPGCGSRPRRAAGGAPAARRPRFSVGLWPWTVTSCTLRSRAAPVRWAWVEIVLGSASTAIRRACGTNSSRNSSRFRLSSGARMLAPVVLPP